MSHHAGISTYVYCLVIFVLDSCIFHPKPRYTKIRKRPIPPTRPQYRHEIERLVKLLQYYKILQSASRRF